MFVVSDIITEKKVLKATASFGVSALAKIGDKTPQGLLRSADQALYEAKRTGKNRVCSI